MRAIIFLRAMGWTCSERRSGNSGLSAVDVARLLVHCIMGLEFKAGKKLKMGEGQANRITFYSLWIIVSG